MKTDKELAELAKPLTNLQRQFVIHLTEGNSQREAYIAAGGTAKKDSTQDAAASRMLSDVKVKAYYDALLEVAAFKAVLTKQEAMQRLTVAAKVTMKDVCDFRQVKIGEDAEGEPVFQTVWTIKNAEDIPDHIAACIKSVTVTKQGPKIELYDSNGSIKLLSEMQGWNAPKKSEITGKDGQALQLKADVDAPEVVNALHGLLKNL